MKFLIAIFTSYIFLLACMPCTDSGICEKENVATHSNHQEPKEHKHNRDEPETCPPFCICACCGISVSVQYVGVSLQKPKDFHNQVVPHYNLAEVPEVFFSIWQPPQLS